MTVKRYFPVRIQDPTSHQHMIRVKPGQKINLSLSKVLFPDVNLEIISDHIKIESCQTGDINRVYVLSHDSSICQWSEYSDFFIGEVLLECEKFISKLAIVMESTNPSKSIFLSVVNPNYFDLRLKPHNVIEVILYNTSFGSQDEWKTNWAPHVPNLGLEQIGSDHLCLQSWNHYGVVDDPSYPYAKLPRVDVSNNNMTRQHHFWFRLGSRFKDLNQFVKEFQGEIQFIGKLNFQGQEDRYKSSLRKETFGLDLYLDCRKPKSDLYLKTLSLKSKDDCSPYDFCSVNDNKKHKIKQSDYPIVRHVDVVVAKQSFDGCREAEPYKEDKISKTFNDDSYEFDSDFYPFPRRNRFPITRFV